MTASEFREQFAAVAFALLMATSMVAGVAILGTQPIGDSDLDGTAAAAPGDQNWTYTGHSGAVRGVAVDETTGKIYSGSGDNEVHAINPDGTQDWAYTGHTDLVMDVAVNESDGTVFSGGWDNEVHAINPDGTVAWTYTQHTDNIYGVAVNSETGTIYTAAGNGEFHAINPDGTHKWNYTGQSGGEGVAVDESTGTVYTAGSSGVVALNADGTQKWTYGNHSNTVRGVAVDEETGTVFSASEDTEVHAINSDGSFKWAYTGHSNGVRGITVDESTGYVYTAGGNDYEVHALTPSGEYEWAYTGHDALTLHEVAVDDSAGYVYSASADNEVHSFEAEGGPRAPEGDVTGVVEDSNGNPVVNATVVAAAVNDSAADNPDVDRSQEEIEEFVQNSEPASWEEQLNQFDEFSEDGFNPSPSDLEQQQRVFMHTEEDWGTQPVPDHYLFFDRVFEGQPPDDLTPRAVIDSDDTAAFACWEPGTSWLEDDIDSSIPGFETSKCDVTVERIDPLDDSTGKRTIESNPLYKVWAAGNLGSKTHHVAAADLEPGYYKVYPEGSPEAATTYAVAPDEQTEQIQTDIESMVQGDCSDAADLIGYEAELCELEQKGAFEAKTTKTNANGEFAFSFNSSVSHVELRATKSGTPLDEVNDSDEFRDEIATDFENTVRSKFSAEAPSSSDLSDYNSGELEEYCREMESVSEDFGAPYYGEARASVPSEDVRITGQRAPIPEDVPQEIYQCGVFSYADDILNGNLANILPSFLDNADLEARFEHLMDFLTVNNDLLEEVNDATGADLVEYLDGDPSGIGDDELETIVNDGWGEVDDGLGFPEDERNGRTGGGDVPAPSPPETDVGELLEATWTVPNVDDWSEDAVALLVRLHFSDGSTKSLDRDSEYVSIEESTFGADEVKLEYPLNETDPASVNVDLDIATSDGIGSDPDTGDDTVKNPTFEGDVPALQHLQLSSLEPQAGGTLTMDAHPSSRAEWGGVDHVNITGPGCERSVDAADDSAEIGLCDEPGHTRVEVVFQNPDGEPFREVFNIETQTTAKSRPPTVRAMTGPTGRWLLTEGAEGKLDVTDGGSTVDIEVVAEEGDIPGRVAAHTTGISLAPETDINVRVAEGDQKNTIRKRIGVTLYTSPPEDYAVYYRNGKPIPFEEQTAYGHLEQQDSDQLVYDTYTGPNAELTFTSSENPGIIERMTHWVRLNWPINNPVASVSPAPLVGMLPLAGLLLVARRRKP